MDACVGGGGGGVNTDFQPPSHSITTIKVKNLAYIYVSTIGGRRMLTILNPISPPSLPCYVESRLDAMIE